MLSPLWNWTSGRKRLLSHVLRAVAAIVVAASVAAGLAALAHDLRKAYLWAGPSIFTAADRDQMASVREALADGEVIFVYAGPHPDDVWQARLWQRGLYPRNPAIVRLDGAREERALQERFAIRRAVLIGPPPSAPKLGTERDLGPIPTGRPGRVSFGELP